MLEKTGAFETTVYKEDSSLKMRLPGGEIVPYDNRFGDLTEIESPKVFPSNEE